jgi:hypothetical protein
VGDTSDWRAFEIEVLANSRNRRSYFLIVKIRPSRYHLTNINMK